MPQGNHNAFDLSLWFSTISYTVRKMLQLNFYDRFIKYYKSTKCPLNTFWVPRSVPCTDVQTFTKVCKNWYYVLNVGQKQTKFIFTKVQCHQRSISMTWIKAFSCHFVDRNCKMTQWSDLVSTNCLKYQTWGLKPCRTGGWLGHLSLSHSDNPQVWPVQFP